MTQENVGLEVQLRGACAELERRLRAGEECSAQDYLAATPQLAADEHTALDLIYTEYTVRSELRESALAQKFFDRYPQFRDALKQQLHFHHWAREELGSANAPTAVDLPTRPTNPAAGANRFEIVEELGRGGIGVVYLAWEIQLSRLVALKMILAGDHASAVDLARFRVEAEAVARLNHPNIVPVYSVGEQDGRPCLALEYVPGGNLSQRLSGRPFPPRRAATLVVQVARAVQYAHERGILHRDLKPANVLLTDDGTPKLTDFSLAKLFVGGTTLTESGSPIGTPNYMAPCQLSSARATVSPATDVYGLGGILYESLTGQPPFRADSVLETLRLVDTRDPIAPSRINPNVPRDLEIICLKCLRKSPAQRYQTADELADDLDRWLSKRPIMARPPTLPEQLLKLFLRRPLSATAISLFVITLLVGFLLVAANWRRAEAARLDAAERAETETQARRELAVELYFNRIALAEREASAGEFGRVEELLSGCDPARRGWEWYYLKRHREGRLPPLAGHEEPVMQVAFGRDERLASCSHGGVIRLWNPITGQLVRTLLGHTDSIRGLSFSLDGRRLASGSEDATVRLWNVDAGHEERVLRGHAGPVAAVAFGPGDRLATAGFDGVVKLWDAGTGKELLTLRGHTDKIFGVAFSPDGRRVASAGRDRTIRLWDAVTGEEVYTLRGHEDVVRRVTFSPHGLRVASASHDQTVRIWDVSSGQELHTLRGHAGYVYGVAFSPDGRRIASAGWDKTVKVWDADSGREAITLRGHRDTVQSVAFSLNGQQLASAGNDRSVQVWDASIRPRSGSNHVLLHESVSWRSSVTYSPDGKRLLSGSNDGAVQVRDIENGREIMCLIGHTDDVLSAVYRSDGKRIASGSEDETVRIWDAETGEGLRTLRGHTDKVRQVVFSPTGHRLASASEDRTVRLWDPETGKEIHILSGHTLAVVGIAFSPDGRRLASASWDRSIRIWDAETGKLLDTLLGHELAVWGVAFSPDGRWLASAGGDGKIIVRDANTRGVVHSFAGHSNRVFAVCFSPDSTRIVSASEDQTVKVWDPLEGKELTTFRGHTDRVWSVAISPDGQGLASASKDRTLRVWHLNQRP